MFSHFRVSPGPHGVLLGFFSKKEKKVFNSCPHTLMGHCHGDFALFGSKLLKYLTENLFSNMKLVLEHREENIKGFIRGRTSYNQF